MKRRKGVYRRLREGREAYQFCSILCRSLLRDFDFPTYLGDPAPEPSVTSSLVRELLQTAPRKVWERCSRLNPDYKAENKGIFDLGSAAHAEFVGEGAEIVIVDAADWRTKVAKETRAAAYAAGKTPIKIADWRRVKAMAEAAKKQFSQHRQLRDILTVRAVETYREASIFWHEAGATCRCRPDLYVGGALPAIIHYKTTGINLNPYTLSKYAASLGWELIAAHYAAGVRALTGKTPCQYFAVQETVPPYLCLVAELDQAFLELGQQRRKRALFTWEWCLRENKWPAWPNGTVVLEAPAWHENDQIKQRDDEQDAIDAGSDLLLQADDWK